MAQLAAASLAPPPGWSSAERLMAQWNAQGEDSEAAALESSLAEQKFPSWEREQVIGRGGFGTVYLGKMQETQQQMAVKTILIQGMNTKELRNIENEIRMIRDLRHRNIVRYLGMEKTATELNIFLEYAAGGSLRQLLQEKGGLSEEETSRYAYQILQGLHYLHSNDKTHRDIKGANVLLSAEGFCKLADFGACKQVDAPSYVSGLKGTPHWMAPEVIRGEQGSAWQKADIWSVGCTVIEMLTGKAPWPDLPNPIAALYRIAHGNTPPMDVEVSPEAREFIDLCCQQDAASRPTAAWLMENSEFLRRHNSAHPGAGPSAHNIPPPPSHQRQDSSLTQRLDDRESRGLSPGDHTQSPQSQFDSLHSMESKGMQRAFFDDFCAPRVAPVQSEEPLIEIRPPRARVGAASPREEEEQAQAPYEAALARKPRMAAHPDAGSSEEDLGKAPRWTQRAVAADHVNVAPVPAPSMEFGGDRPPGAHGRRISPRGGFSPRYSPVGSPATSPRRNGKGKEERRRRTSKHKRQSKEKLELNPPLGERPSAPPTGEHLGMNAKHRDDSRVRLRMAEVRNAAKRESTELGIPSPNPRRLVKSAGSLGKLPPLPGRTVATAPSSSTMHASLQFDARQAEAATMRNSMPAAVHSSPTKPSRKKKSKHPY